MKNKENLTPLKLGPINSFIVKLNRPSFVILITAYLAILVLIIFFISPDTSRFVIRPNYEHDLFPEEVRVRYEMVPRYVYDEEKDETKVNYSLASMLQGTFDEGNVDPRYVVKRFQASVYLSSNTMKYLSEKANYQTTISHTLPLNLDGKQIYPETVYTVIKYEDKESTIKTQRSQEDFMLELKDRSLFTRVSTISHMEGEGEAATEVVDVRLAFEKVEDSASKTYEIGTRILLKDYAHRYHIDMQSWVVAENGKVYPFIGVYGFWNQSTYYRVTSVKFPQQLKPEYIYSELHYYTPVDDEVGYKDEVIRYMVRIANLPNNVSTTPNYTDERQTPITTSIIPWDRINLIGWPIIIGIAVAGVVYYTSKRKKEIPQ
ncbi:MAG: hypothetical protein PHY42_00980 [Bacilli bacterium]|nr:hypothetical protein [Bacilli bacterium]